jgi:hypothetical protein
LAPVNVNWLICVGNSRLLQAPLSKAVIPRTIITLLIPATVTSKLMENIPSIGLGTFRLKGNTVQQPIRDAIRLGYRHIDTAAIYHNEKDIGLVLQELYNE